MALVPETGAGLTNADTYNSLVELAAYHAAEPRWTTDDDGNAVSEPFQEKAARTAAYHLDGMTEEQLSGCRSVADQALAHPRAGATYKDGRAILPTVVPPEIKRAHAELSLAALKGEIGVSQDRGGAISSVELGPLAVEYGDNAPGGATFPYVDTLLAPLLRPANRSRRA
jgi:hypothetical protein